MLRLRGNLNETTTHDLFDRRESGASPSGAGLVLLFAPDHEKLPHVVSLEHATVLVVGREPPPGGLVLPHSGVSRLHARLAKRGESWTIADLESRNGTLVDGVRIAQETTLRDGAELRIGDTVWKHVASSIDLYAPYRLDGSLARGAHVARASKMDDLVGGAQMQRLALELEAIARADLSVVVLGETGTGKEVVARALHAASGRRGPFQGVNCAAIPTHLLESELFGYRRGAFSGADRDKPGLVRAANGGTLLLDEIGDMPLEAQAKLLRAIETREVLPLGATTGEPIDVRVVSATHRDLDALVSSGKFRGDLLARIQGYVARLPPLRARKEDVWMLTRHFLRKHGRPTLGVSTSFALALVHHDWPYNVRELEGVVRRAIALADAERATQLEMRHLPEGIVERVRALGREPASTAISRFPPPPTSRGEAPPTPPRGEAPGESELRALLVRHKGNVAAIARELGKDRVQIHRWMKRWSLDPDDFR